VSHPTFPQYVDHPAPSPLLVLALIAIVGAFLASIPGMTEQTAGDTASWGAIAVVTIAILTVCFYFWPLYTTYYTLSPSGLIVRYGPWKRRYSWSEFVGATWRRGMFATRIGWPSVTPCVRLADAVILRKKGKSFGLYLTPNDSRAFLKWVSELAPDLTRESIF
jgi:hypothetical protein